MIYDLVERSWRLAFAGIFLSGEFMGDIRIHGIWVDGNNGDGIIYKKVE